MQAKILTLARVREQLADEHGHDGRVLIAVAISTSVLYGASPFWQLVPPTESGWVFYAMIVAWVFVLCRATISGFYVWYQEYAKTHAKFSVTPIESQCLWSAYRDNLTGHMSPTFRAASW